MNIITESYEQISNQYLDACKWMESIGVKLGTGRTKHYEKIIFEWSKIANNVSYDQFKINFSELVNALFEIFDFIYIHQSFKSTDILHLTLIIEKLNKGVNGPIKFEDETPENTAARNYLFEAIVAATMHQPSFGIETILNAQSDTGILFSDKKIWIECKRIYSDEQIEKRILKASCQLNKILNSQLGSGNRGIIVLDITNIFNKNLDILAVKDETELAQIIRSYMDEVIKINSPKWQKILKNKHKKIIGVIVRFALIAGFKSKNHLVHTKQWAFNPREGIDKANELVLRNLCLKLDQSI